MKISTKGRYGIRAMIDLALHSTGGHVSLSAIAGRQHISANYLEQVFSALRKADLVRSVKGAQGGYSLTAPADTMTIGSILRALEGDFSVAKEDTDREHSSDNRLKRYIQTNLWDKMADALNGLTDSITLGDLVDDYKKMNEGTDPMYYI